MTTTVLQLLVNGVAPGAACAPLRKKLPVSVSISTIAVGIMLQHGVNATFGPEPRNGPPLLETGTVTIGAIALSIQQIAVIVAAACLIATTGLLLSRMQVRRRLRATAQDPEMAEAIGINGAACIAMTFAIALAAGTLLSSQLFVTSGDGGMFMLKGLSPYASEAGADSKARRWPLWRSVCSRS